MPGATVTSQQQSQQQVMNNNSDTTDAKGKYTLKTKTLNTTRNRSGFAKIILLDGSVLEIATEVSWFPIFLISCIEQNSLYLLEIII